MPTEASQARVVTPSLQQWSHRPSEERLGEDPLKWLKNSGMSITKPLDSWEAFKNGLSGLFGDRQKYTRRAEEQLKCRAQRSGEEKRSFKTKLKGFGPSVNKTYETEPRPTYAAVTGKYRAPVQKFPPEPRKTDRLKPTADDNRPVCFHCEASWTCNALLPREKGCLWQLSETADGTGDVGTERKYVDQTLLAVLRQIPARSPIRRYRSPSPYRASSQSPAVGARKTKESDLPGDKKPIRALVDSGASFSVISDKYRRFLKKVLFADAKSVMLKVADGNFVRPIGKCVLRVRINNRELPFEFIVLSHCSHDVILGWDFLEASQAVIDCGQNELVLEDICRDSTAPDAWNLYATRDYTLKPHSLTRITVSGYQTRGDINVVLDGSKHLLFEKNIATPSMVSTYRNGKSDVWVTNLQFETKSSLEECA
ncbi:transposon Ty3-I Gag-Pol polyprotein [Trichonephila clavipes]|nr:transposon Ty3-I Gag-Pol polyprotein [Trichonephila clavipes]